MAELHVEQLEWRERVLRGIALSLATVCVLTAIWYALVPNPFPQLGFVLLASAVALAAVARPSPLAFTGRGTIVLAAIYVPCAYALLDTGFNPNSFVGFGMLVLAGTLLFGRRAGLGLTGLVLLTILVVAYSHAMGVYRRIPAWPDNLDSTRPAVIVRVLLVFGLLTGTIVIAVSYLLTRTEELALGKQRSLETLQKEQLERERISQDLELREAAFHKARELELLGRLAGTMAHDFNNALLVILSSLDELEAAGGAPCLDSPLAAIRAASEQAAATTRQLRAFGPMAPRRPSELELAPVLEKANVMFSRVLPQNIHVLVDARAPARIVADEGELLRVLMNLVLNARDAMRDGGELTLRARPACDGELSTRQGAGGYVAIEVLDTGSGMSDDVKRRLFEPFFTTKHASGTGLGLASVRDIVEAQGGSIAVTSEVGLGTTISVLWPLAPVVAARVESPAPTPSVKPGVVLLVDDDDAVRLAVSRGLMRLGMTVLEAADGAAGLVAARRHHGHIDALCTDCVMAGLPVRQLIAGFREFSAGSVIVCSGYAPAETGLSPELFDDFLPKPFSIVELAKRIGAGVERRIGNSAGT